MRRILALDTLHLSAGAHRASGNEMCVMEAVAYVAGEPWSDHPQCASPVIAAFCRTWNDTKEPYGQAIRDRLRFYVPRLVGSRGTPQQEERRAWLAMDWLIRVCAPAWLRLAGLTTHADALAQLPPQVSYKAVSSSAATRAAAGAAARAAGDAAEDAAWAAGDAGTVAGDAGDAARDAARAAARDAWAAAWAATRAAAWAATWAAGDAAGDAAWAVAWAVAGDAGDAGDAARDAARAAAWAAAGTAARDVFKPTVGLLQTSAWQLLDAMLACQ